MFEFVGRADRQVKIRGFRVEPGEIESALNRLSAVAASAVVPEIDAGGHTSLVGYWVAREAPVAIMGEVIASELRRSLPEYMVPARIEQVRELPLTPNGKIDRKRLQEAGVAGVLRAWGSKIRGADDATARETEPDTANELLGTLVQLAAAVLRSPVGLGDAERPMGELGFDSIRFTALSTVVARTVGVAIEEVRFYELKTLRGVADFLATKGARIVAAPSREIASHTEHKEALAIVGIDARLPAAEDLGQFWRNLVQGLDGVGPMTAERRKLAGPAGSEFEGGYIANIDKFDAPFFGISRREATATDPRQRLFLEASWRALEDAGIRPSSLAGSRTGVFVGMVGGSEYSGHSDDAEVDAGAQRILGAATSLIAARVSYQLDLRGPSHAIDTACSSSLVALHRAAVALRAGECDLAIVGGINLVLDDATTRTAAKTGMISRTARCRAFDVKADGYVRGEGVVALVIKPLARALADGDPVHALVLGTAENHGGRAAGLTAPNPEAQRDVVLAALSRAGVGAETISYIEAHGTGTQLGDPIEINGLRAAFARGASGKLPSAAWCTLGAVKSQIGHLEAAAGLAGLVKVVLAMRAGVIPGNLHLRERNPRLELEGSPFVLADSAKPWIRRCDAAGHELPRRAGVSSFGFSGVNAHVVLEEFRAPLPVQPTTEGPSVWTLSAKTKEALAGRAAQLETFLQENPACALRDVAATLLLGREPMSERVRFLVHDRAEALEILHLLASGRADARLRRDELSMDVPAGARRIHLPTYPFERRSYWASAPLNGSQSSLGREARVLASVQPVLDEHRVAGKAILPAVAYLDWVLCVAGRAEFKACEFRSVFWARALEVGPEPVPARVKLEYQQGAMPFVIESGDSPAVIHAKGSLHWLESGLHPQPAVADVVQGKPWGTDEIYRFFAEKGMHYGPLFRTLRGAEIGRQSARGELEAATSADDFLLHPGMLDGMLQVAALLSMASGAEPGMPFTAERIRVLAPLGRRLTVHVRKAADDTLELWAVRPDGVIVLTLHGYAVRAPASGVISPLPATRDSLAVAAEAGVRAHGDLSLSLDAARVERECAGLERLEMLGRLILLKDLQALGILRAPGDSISYDELKRVLRAVPRYLRLCESLGRFLAQSGLVEETASGLLATSHLTDPFVRAELAELPAALERFKAEQPHLAPHATFVWNCIQPLARIIDGSVLATDVMFPGGSVEFISKIYDGTVLMDYFNRVAAVAVRSAAAELLRTKPAGSVVRILEFGAGSGATSAWIAEALRELGAQVEYVFTDISVAFRRHGERRFGMQYPFMRFGVLNIERDPVEQGFAADSFDIAIGANVLHTIKSLHRSLHLLKTLLVPGGMLALVEGTESRVLNGLTYGLLDGWWNFEDPERRLPNAPLCNEEQWLRALREEGFTDVRLLGKDSAPARRMTQAVIVGVSDGRVAVDVSAPTLAAQTVGLSASELPEQTTEADLDEVLIEEVLGVVRLSLQAKDEVIGLDATFESLGVDSILAVEIVEKLNHSLHLKLRTTDVFNYASVRRLSRRMAEIIDADGRAKLLARRIASRPANTPIAAGMPASASGATPSPAAVDRARAPVAIVGMAGQYAEASNLSEFWANLASGRDCVTEVPSDRWSITEHFSPDRRVPGKTYSKWGGFLKDAAGFDPIFFNCSPREADLMDPQQRLFLMECYHALEDAGYSERMMDDQRCAVFAGVCAGDYQAQLDRAGQWAESHVFTGNATAILAGRLPYLLNLKGVGLAVDTACSSSLVAIHLACESLRAGSCTMALAGGVAVMSSERFHVWASKAGMLSASGRCRTFGATADGIAPAEGVGVVVLKLLDDAVRDGDHIHGVILGSGVNQNGRSNGITAPSVPAQAELESYVYREFGVDPATIDYVECHGTGTRLGDPMEVSALTDAFRQWTPRTGFCVLGAVKSNIGHALAAAGVAGLLKVLLAMKHRQIPGSLHCGQINDQLSLDGSPFVIARKQQPWAKTTLRRAAVSAFGFSGANAHAVIEEAPEREADLRPVAAEHVFTLAAHTGAALKNKQQQLLTWLDSADGRVASLADVAYTLNLGRAHFARRWVVVADTRSSLIDALRSALAQAEIEKPTAPAAPAGKGVQATEQTWRGMISVPSTRGLAIRGLSALYEAGHDVDWSFVHAGVAGRRIPLPGYPFELRRCWISQAGKVETSGLRLGSPERRGGEWMISGSFTANAPMLAQHRVQGVAILPGVASLELARCAAQLLRPGYAPTLRNVAWLRPLRAEVDGAETRFVVRVAEGGEAWRFTVSPEGREGSRGEELVCARGEMVWDARSMSVTTLDVASLRRRILPLLSREDFYQRFVGGGVSYGPYFKVVRELRRGEDEVLARLELGSDEGLLADMLHPGLMDGALQAAAGLALDLDAAAQSFRFPFAAGRIEIFGPLTTHLWVHARGSIETGATVTLADEDGRIAVVISDYVTRAPKIAPLEVPRASYFTPTWRDQALETHSARSMPSVSGAVWIVSRQDTELERALAARHDSVVWICLNRAGTGGAGQEWRIDVSAADAWSLVIRELPRPAVIYFLTGNLRAEDFSDELACVQAAKEEGVLALFRMTKALQTCGWWEPGLMLKVAVQGVWTLPGEEMQPPYFAAVAGFVGSLGREYAQIGAACIDMGKCTADNAAAAAAALACEPLRTDSPRVAWRDGRRFEAGLGRMEVQG